MRLPISADLPSVSGRPRPWRFCLCCGRAMWRRRSMSPTALDIDVHGLHRGFLRAAAARGSRLLCDAEVRRIGRRNGTWQLETGAGAFEAPVVVNAAGAWADEIAGLAGVRPIGLQPKRRTAFTFDGPAGLGDSSCRLHRCRGAVLFKPEAGRFLGSLADETPCPPATPSPRRSMSPWRWSGSRRRPSSTSAV
jgi:Glycine/D-amino acid oxidases (deaminating)